MRMTSKLAALLAVLMGTASVHAATLIPVPQVPGSTATFVESINDDNIVAGDYTDSDGGTHAFFGTLGGSYTTFDADAVNQPGTEARGINNRGVIIGIANVTQLDTTQLTQFERYTDGSVHFITNHGSELHGITGGVNAKGVFVSENWNEDNTVDGFLGKKAKIRSQIDLGISTFRVRPRDVTVSGDVIGYTKVTSNTGYQGFILHDGSTALINYPDENASNTLLEGANSKGTVTGFWEDSNFDQFAFIYNSKTAQFTPLTVPGFPQSGAGGVNTAGLIAVEGYSQDLSQSAPYIYCPKKPSKCPAGGFEIADPKPVAMVPGYKPHAVPNHAALTALKAMRQIRQ